MKNIPIKIQVPEQTDQTVVISNFNKNVKSFSLKVYLRYDDIFKIIFSISNNQ